VLLTPDSPPVLQGGPLTGLFGYQKNGGTSVIVKVHSSFPFRVIRREKVITLSILGMPHPTACGRRWVRDKRTALGTNESIRKALPS
jgi:hypothetical protein